ncbi:hypothetical protein [Halobacterium yunchengense]|uniref:hypothetical protein n=1 Tax=Halobacterium yunchengense TaxID=3108497 RepID=UPI00300B27E0
MDRRALLATAAATATALVAGCTGRGAGDDPNDDGTTTGGEPTSDEPTDATTDGGGGRFPYTARVADAGDPPTEDVTVDAAVTEDFSREAPARLRVSFTNDADEAREFTFGSLVPWDTILGEQRDGDASLLLAPSDDVVPDGPTDDCWQATDGVALPAVMRSETLDAGETASATFSLLAAHDSGDCHPPGTYRFADENYVDGGWWFDVEVAPVAED